MEVPDVGPLDTVQVYAQSQVDGPDPDRRPHTYWYELVAYAAVSPTVSRAIGADFSAKGTNYNRITATVWRGGCADRVTSVP